MCFDNRKWNILAFRGRLMSLLELRSSGSHRGLSSHRSLAYSICWVGGYHGKNKMLSAASLIGTEGDDSCRHSTCLKTPSSRFLEETEALPAARVCLQWKSTVCCA